jgi:hypothetical protein
MNFAQRPPSPSWERLPVADAPQQWVWAWFKPPHAPHGLVVRVPEEAFRDDPGRPAPTLRKVLHSAGIDPRSVSIWYLYGAPHDARQGANPLLDAVIPQPPPGADPTILVLINPLALPWSGPPPGTPAAPMFQAVPPSGGHQPSAAAILARIDAEWNSILEIETQLNPMRKQVQGTLSRINALNRDLSAEERVSSDNQDKSDWLDARRWLRDASARLSRFIKDYDVGHTSSAGRRNWFEATYQQHVAHRRPFEGMEQAERDYETYRKTLQTLLMNMHAANTAALQDAERRAQGVLSRIGAKVRAARAKRA